MLDIEQARGKRHPKVVAHRADCESCPFPVEIVVVRDCGHSSLREEFGKSNAKGNVHGYCQRVLHNQEVNLKTLSKFVELRPKRTGKGVNRIGSFSRPMKFPPDAVRNSDV